MGQGCNYCCSQTSFIDLPGPLLLFNSAAVLKLLIKQLCWGDQENVLSVSLSGTEHLVISIQTIPLHCLRSRPGPSMLQLDRGRREEQVFSGTASRITTETTSSKQRHAIQHKASCRLSPGFAQVQRFHRDRYQRDPL